MSAVLGVDELMVFFLILLLLGLIVILIAIRKEKKTEDLQMLAARARITNDLEELDTAIADWLEMLELPGLAEETKRLEAASRLRIVLIEKLLQQRILC